MISPSTASQRVIGHERTRERLVLLNQMFLAIVVLLAALLILLTDDVRNPANFAGGVALTFLASGAALVVPWNRVPQQASMLIPFADIAVIALLSDACPNAGLEILWVFPAMWIGSVLGAPGVAIASAVITAIYWIMVSADPGRTFSPAVILVPVAIAALATISYFSAQRAQAHRLLLERQSQHLRQSVERSRRQEDLVTDVLDAVDFGVIRITTDGSLVVTNEAYARLQRSPSGRARAFSADGITSLAADQLPLARARRGELFEDELVWYGRPGDERRRALRSTARRVTDTDLHDAGTIVVTRDVTAEELALRAREDLVASVSHELRTPLTSIMGYLELALDSGGLPESVRRNLGVAERNAERLLELVSDILTVSAVSRRGVDLSIDARAGDLAPVVQASIEAAMPRASERHISIDASGIETADAFADPHRIRQVVDNLVSNAIKYGRDGGRIEVGATQDGAHAWIVVRDDGPGISEQELPRLFERFFRSDTVRNTTTHGSGLGLAISRDIVRAHGGEITVQSTLGRGTTFVVRLPAAHPQAALV